MTYKPKPGTHFGQVAAFVVELGLRDRLALLLGGPVTFGLRFTSPKPMLGIKVDAQLMVRGRAPLKGSRFATLDPSPVKGETDAPSVA